MSDTITKKTIQVNITEEICRFTSFEQWVNKASSWLVGISKMHVKGTMLCLDKDGNVLLIGEDFMAARDHDRFPVTVYLLTRSCKAELKIQPSCRKIFRRR